MGAEGINFTRMYTEPSCTPTRAAVLTGRHPVRHSMGVVGHAARVLGDACGRGDHRRGALRGRLRHGLLRQGAPGRHRGELPPQPGLRRGALHADEPDHLALQPAWARRSTRFWASTPRSIRRIPYQLDTPGLLAFEGWVQIIEGKKGEQGKEWCGTSNECYDKPRHRVREAHRSTSSARTPRRASRSWSSTGPTS